MVQVHSSEVSSLSFFYCLAPDGSSLQKVSQLLVLFKAFVLYYHKKVNLGMIKFNHFY